MTGSAPRKPRPEGGDKRRNQKQTSSLPGSPPLRAGSFTLQAKGFQWSVGIHGMLLLVIAVLPGFFVSPNKIAVIDFTLSEGTVSSAAAQALPQRAPAPRQEAKHDKAARPREIVEGHTAPTSEVKETISPSEVSSNKAEIPSSLPQAPDSPAAPAAEKKESAMPSPQAVDGLSVPAANGAFRDAANAAGSAHDTAGSAHGTAGSSGKSGAGASQEKSGGEAFLAADTGGSDQGTAGGPGNAPAGATPEISRAAYLKEHFVYIRDRITGSISYPYMARKMGWRGQVKIAFVVREDGGVNDVRVIESSGFGLLDQNAIDTVKNVAPFPSPPVRAEIRMAITYRLN